MRVFSNLRAKAPKEKEGCLPLPPPVPAFFRSSPGGLVWTRHSSQVAASGEDMMYYLCSLTAFQFQALESWKDACILLLCYVLKGYGGRWGGRGKLLLWSQVFQVCACLRQRRRGLLWNQSLQIPLNTFVYLKASKETHGESLACLSGSNTEAPTIYS